jgi:hypothetical protein
MERGWPPPWQPLQWAEVRHRQQSGKKRHCNLWPFVLCVSHYIFSCHHTRPIVTWSARRGYACRAGHLPCLHILSSKQYALGTASGQYGNVPALQPVSRNGHSHEEPVNDKALQPSQKRARHSHPSLNRAWQPFPAQC